MHTASLAGVGGGGPRADDAHHEQIRTLHSLTGLRRSQQDIGAGIERWKGYVDRFYRDNKWLDELELELGWGSITNYQY